MSQDDRGAEGAPSVNAGSGGYPPEPVWAPTADPDITLDLPPRLRLRPLGGRSLSRWLAAALVVLALAIVIPTVLLARSGGGSTSTVVVPSGCDVQGSPCQVTQTFMGDYTAGKYEAMYQLVSQASIARFGTAAILHNAYKDAHDYIVNRTQALLQAAQVYSVTASIAGQHVTGANSATVAVHVVMQTIRVGTITQDVVVPLAREHGHWLVNWSPGLVFAHLDDPADPQYQRLLHLFVFNGHRGSILDGAGNVLAQDDTIKVIGIVPGQIKDAAVLLKTLATDLDYTADQLTALYAGHGASEFVQVRSVTQQTYAGIAADLAPLVGAGVQVNDGVGRVYPYGADTAAVTGYVAPVSDQDLINDSAHYYEPNDVVGRDGVEAWADLQLRPLKGGELDIVPVNADGTLGQAAYTTARRAPADGADVHTTINLKLQQKAIADMRATQKASGSVVLDPTTGEVLVLASTPIYDPNDFSLGFTPNQAARFNALDHPYLNRAVAGAYPTGSVMKVTTLAAALEAGIPSDRIFNCPGSWQVPGSTDVRIDDAPTGHGMITDLKALAASCDVVFWQISAELFAKDRNLLPNMAKAMGYGATTGIVGLPSGVESAGNVSVPDSPGTAANLGIGQGDFKATPLQLAMVAQAIANNGQRMQPRLVTSVVSTTSQALASYPAKPLNKLPLTADHLAILQAAMLGPTTDPTGTAYFDFGHFSVRVAGKTGTSESGQSLAHALFICYAPASPVGGPAVTPVIAVGVVVELAGGTGEQFAVPIAKDLVETALGVTS
jgi:penicillin-binding protein 2